MKDVEDERDFEDASVVGLIEINRLELVATKARSEGAGKTPESPLLDPAWTPARGVVSRKIGSTKLFDLGRHVGGTTDPQEFALLISQRPHTKNRAARRFPNFSWPLARYHRRNPGYGSVRQAYPSPVLAEPPLVVAAQGQPDRPAASAQYSGFHMQDSAGVCRVGLLAYWHPGSSRPYR